MTKCPSCGAKNRDHFEFCIRCSEPLVATKSSSIAIPAVSKLALVFGGVTVLVVSLFAFRGLATRDRSEPSTSPSAEAISAPSADLETSPPTGPSELAVDPSDFEKAAEINRRAMAAFREGAYEAALGLFNELSELSPSNATAHLYAGLCLERLGNLLEAITRLHRVVELQPTNEEAMGRVIPLLVQSGNLEVAESLQARLVEQNPFDPKPLVGLGRIHRQKGKVELALEEHQKAVEMDSSNQAALLELGITYNEAGRHREALEACQKVIELDAANPAAHAGVGTSLLLAKRYSEAVAPLEEGIRLAPENADLRLKMAMAYENTHRVEDSLREYESFVKLTKDEQMAIKVTRLVKRARAALAEREVRP